MNIDTTGRVGISNTSPQSMLHLGDCSVSGSAPVIGLIAQEVELIIPVISLK